LNLGARAESRFRPYSGSGRRRRADGTSGQCQTILFHQRLEISMERDSVLVPRAVLDAMLEDAAERGARKAMERIGLQDERAGKDVAELRSLLEAWRDTKATARRTVVKWAIGVMLAAIAAGVALTR